MTKKDSMCLLWVSNPVPSAYKADALPFELKRLRLTQRTFTERMFNKEQPIHQAFFIKYQTYRPPDTF